MMSRLANYGHVDHRYSTIYLRRLRNQLSLTKKTDRIEYQNFVSTLSFSCIVQGDSS